MSSSTRDIPHGTSMVRGLVLAGGRSRRMGTDKAAMRYHGVEQVRYLLDLLSSICREVYVSIRDDQSSERLYRNLPTIVDTMNDAGPMAGVYSAMLRFPDSAWLVVPVDIPNLAAEHLLQLMAHRRQDRAVIAAQGRGDGSADPLVALYEPAALHWIEQSLGDGKRSLRSIVNRCGDVVVLGSALHNVNSPRDATDFDQEDEL